MFKRNLSELEYEELRDRNFIIHERTGSRTSAENPAYRYRDWREILVAELNHKAAASRASPTSSAAL